MCEYVSNWYLYECFKRSLDYFKKLYFSITLLSRKNGLLFNFKYNNKLSLYRIFYVLYCSCYDFFSIKYVKCVKINPFGLKKLLSRCACDVVYCINNRFIANHTVAITKNMILYLNMNQ